jgi:hypothetical protein
MAEGSFAELLASTLTEKGLQEIVAQSAPDDLLKIFSRPLDGSFAVMSMWRRGPADEGPGFGSKIREEMHLLICTSDRKYAKLRVEITKRARAGELVVVSTIAAVFAKNIGAAAGAMSAFIAVCLMVLLKVGKEAFCKHFV